LFALMLSAPSVRGQDTTAVRVTGLVERELTITLTELKAMPQQTVTASAHKQSGTYSGVALTEILRRAGVPSGEAIRGREMAKFVVVKGSDGYAAVFALAELDAGFTDRVIVIAHQVDGKPLPNEYGPLQLIVPGEKRPSRWVRQVVAIEVRQAQ
jgi:DMSO/TMAO reductase YedYZ molybdopterin-dependent catalytic subunit